METVAPSCGTKETIPNSLDPSDCRINSDAAQKTHLVIVDKSIREVAALSVD